MKITSAQNPKLKWLRQLLTQKEARSETSLFVAEGVRLVEDALAAGHFPEAIFYSEALSSRAQALVTNTNEAVTEQIELPAHLMDRMAETENSQGILAVFKQPQADIPDPLDFVLICDTIRDPGNLGTLLRSAAAAGVQLCLFPPQTVDPYSPKVVRAGMGAHFHLPLRQTGWEEVACICSDLQVFMAEAEAGVACWQQDLSAPLALLVGSEATGPSEAGRALANTTISIPMPGKFESLNAAVAGTILLFEVVRQRLA